MRIPKYKKVSFRTERLKKEADELLSKGYLIASILYYAIYVEQLLLTAYLFVIREDNIDNALLIRENLLQLKQEEELPFGRVIMMTVPKITQFLNNKEKLPTANNESLSDLCDKMRRIRNLISAHPYFVVMLDPTNRWGRGMSDANFYKKTMRRVRYFIEDEIGMKTPENLDYFIKFGHPLSMSSTIDKEFETVERSVIANLALLCESLSTKIANELTPLIPKY